MTKINDGGPAFPCSNEQFTAGNPTTGDAAPGMSLRDWFAGQVLAGFCSNTSIDWTKPGVGLHVAEQCWKQADAMIAAREPKP